MTSYLDTSAVNFLADNTSQQDISYLRNMGIKFYISSITLWEILLNSDNSRKEELLFWAQTHCENQLLKAPSEILVEYLDANCPEKNRKNFWEDPFTKLELGDTWTKIHGDISMTIPIEVQELKDFTYGNRLLSRKIRKILRDMTDPDYPKKDSDYFYLSAKKIAEDLDFPWTLKYQSHFITAVILVFFLFCIGQELDKTTIRDYWEQKSIDDHTDRLEYLMLNYPMYFKRGPIAEMTMMVQSQDTMSKNPNRGLIHDCLQVIYCYFVDVFITDDKHFLKFRSMINHPAFRRIIVFSEIEKYLSGFSG